MGKINVSISAARRANRAADWLCRRPLAAPQPLFSSILPVKLWSHR